MKNVHPVFQGILAQIAPPTPTSMQVVNNLESHRSILLRSARRALSVGQIEAAVKWHGEAQDLEPVIDAARKAVPKGGNA